MTMCVFHAHLNATEIEQDDKQLIKCKNQYDGLAGVREWWRQMLSKCYKNCTKFSCTLVNAITQYLCQLLVNFISHISCMFFLFYCRQCVTDYTNSIPEIEFIELFYWFLAIHEENRVQKRCSWAVCVYYTPSGSRVARVLTGEM